MSNTTCGAVADVGPQNSKRGAGSEDLVLKGGLKARLRVEHSYYQAVDNVEAFKDRIVSV
ncbi:hypothetical protein EYF80_042462 [Liparis tanakae]|uniref:Uncharacterized protein n=1 Tax=Liparis tanakae TaxID=230148 RepID=A0A4Z2G2M5_9TELE|nr:hypothetical protein EYF80_042462 [Liparis tanakae]